MAAAWHDLSHPIRTGMTVGGKKLEVELSAHVGVSPGGDRIHTTGIAMNTHSGTHVDVPFHFAEDGARLQQLPVERFIGTGAVVDVPGAECREVTLADVGDVIEAIGPDAILLVNTGWWRNYDQPATYARHPYLDEAVVSLCIARQLKMVGTDTLTPERPSVARPEDYVRKYHHALLSAGVLIAENLNFDGVPAGRYEIIAAPLNIWDGDGAPARIIARKL
jgi:kynurenine formamidase